MALPAFPLNQKLKCSRKILDSCLDRMKQTNARLDFVFQGAHCHTHVVLALSGRVELPSKQATKKLSTRLFPDLVFDFVVGQEQPHIA
jgi:hypothetical protein